MSNISFITAGFIKFATDLAPGRHTGQFVQETPLSTFDLLFSWFAVHRRDISTLITSMYIIALKVTEMQCCRKHFSFDTYIAKLISS